MANLEWTGASSGVYTTAGNWSTGSAPTGGDSVSVGSQSTQAITGSDQSATALVLFRVLQANAYNVGSTALPLQIDTDVFEFGEPSQDGTSGTGATTANFYLENTSSTVVCRIYGSSSQGENGLTPLRIRTAAGNNTLAMYNGIVGLATNAVGDTAEFSTIDQFAGTLYMGTGVTVATLRALGGSCVLRSAVGTKLIVQDGFLEQFGTGTIAAFDAKGRALMHGGASATTITTLNVYDDADLDFRQCQSSFAVGTINIYSNNHVFRQAYTGQLTWTTLNILSGDFNLEADGTT